MGSDSRLIGYGGSRGGAKSYAARTCAILRRGQFPGTKALIFRKNYDDLWQNHIMPLMEEWPTFFEAGYSAEHRSLTMPATKTDDGKVYPGGIIYFRYADTLQDVLKFRGKEYGDVFIDEATDLDEMEIAVLSSCCRSTVETFEGFQPTKVLTFNPGGPGHAFCKRVFIDKDWTAEEAELNPTFLQAHAWDNKEWVAEALAADGFTVEEYYDWSREAQIKYFLARADYAKTLNALPDELRKAWLWGDWDQFAGQVFSEFRREVHVVEPFEVPAHWRRFGANDPGYNDPGVWYWCAVDEDGNVYVYREQTFHSSTHADEDRVFSAQAVEVKRLTGTEDVRYWVTGMDAFISEKGRRNGKTFVDYYNEAGLFGFRRPINGSGSRATRAMTMHEYLKVKTIPSDIEGRPPRKEAKLRIFSSCKELIRTLPSLPRDELDPECVKDCSIDHWFDAITYALCSRHTKHADPVEDKPPPGSYADIFKADHDLRPKKKKLSAFG